MHIKLPIKYKNFSQVDFSKNTSKLQLQLYHVNILLRWLTLTWDSVMPNA